MPQKLRDEGAEILRFGGGINSRASEGQIDPIECTTGQNFILDPGNGEFRPRAPFDKVGTTPNEGEIRGFATLQKSDGTVTMLVQSGANVYKWDGAATFTLVGTVAASARLRGPKQANWALSDKVLITDLNLAEEIHEWDGTTLSQTAFLEADGSSSFGAFRAKYCVVENERAFFGNIHESGQNFPHLFVASERGDYLIVSASVRAGASGIGADAPWFLAMPQLKPINGMAFAFGVLAISQESGAFEKLVGNDSTDFKLEKLHDGSGAAGDEAVVSTGNDIIYGAPGRVESLQSTDKFGDVEFDDISFKVQPNIRTFKDWALVYNPRLKRIYCFPDDQSECWVLYTDFIGADLSGWSKWVTDHILSFQPTAAMLCRDPADGLEYVFMGDGLGNVYRLEGSGELGDAGTATVTAKRTSVLFAAPLDTKAFGIEGWLQHRKRLANTVNMRFLMAGEHVHDVRKSIELSEVVFDTLYGGNVYYGGQFYYGVAQENRLVRRIWGLSAMSNQFQIELEVQGLNDFAVTECGFRFNVAS